MTQSDGTNPDELRQRLVQDSLTDQELRERLLGDIKATVESEPGTSFPEDLEICAVEETSEVVYLVLPPAPQEAPDTDELTEEPLTSVSGGGDDSWTSSGDRQVYASNPCSY